MINLSGNIKYSEMIIIMFSCICYPKTKSSSKVCVCVCVHTDYIPIYIIYSIHLYQWIKLVITWFNVNNCKACLCIGETYLIYPAKFQLIILFNFRTTNLNYNIF